MGKKRPREEKLGVQPPSSSLSLPSPSSPSLIEASHKRKKTKKAKRDKGPSTPNDGKLIQEPHPLNKKAKQDGKANSIGLPEYPYEVDYCDHFETPLNAYQDIEPFLYWYAKKLGKKKTDLRIYDPYYCKGSVRTLLAQLGFAKEKVINRMTDFYADMKAGLIPDYDVLITNPPYSGDHKERVIDFCLASGKPWFLLMPNYVANKAYYQTKVLSSSASGPAGTTARASHPQQKQDKPIYVVPKSNYEYSHPEGTGHASSPFFSIWYIFLPGLVSSKEGSGWLERSKNMHGGRWKVVMSTEGLRESGAAPSWKRPNNKRRQKLKAKQMLLVRKGGSV